MYIKCNIPYGKYYKCDKSLKCHHASLQSLKKKKRSHVPWEETWPQHLLLFRELAVNRTNRSRSVFPLHSPHHVDLRTSLQLNLDIGA